MLERRSDEFPPHDTSAFYLMHIYTIRHGACTDSQQRLLAAFCFFSCISCFTFVPASRLFSAWTCVCFANNNNFFDNQQVASRLDRFENNF